jgi:hypothetical protein
MRLAGAGERQAHRLRPGCEQQPVIGEFAAARGLDLARTRIDPGNVLPQMQLNIVLGIETVRAQRYPVLRRAAGEIVFREIRPVDRHRIVIAQHHDAALVPLPPQCFGGGKAGRTTADDDDFFRRFGGGRAAGHGRNRRRFPAHEYLALSLLDRKTRQWAQGRRAQRLTCAQAETGMVPGAAHGIVNQQPLGQIRVIMGAMCPDREQRRAAAHEQNLFGSGITDELAAIAKLPRVDALGQIGTA